MTALVMAIGLFLAVMAEALFPGAPALGQAKLPMLFAVVLYYAMERDRRALMVAGIGAGFLHDAMSPIPLGYSTCCFCLVGWYVSRFRKLVLTDSWLTQMFFGALSSLVTSLLLAVLLLKSQLVVLSFPALVFKLLGTALLGAVCAPLVFYTLGNLDRIVGNVSPLRDVEGPTGDFDAASE